MSNLAVYLLNIEECCTLSDRLISVFKSDLSEEPSVQKIFPHIEALNDDLTSVMSRITSNTDLTRQIAENDAARDTAFIGFRDYCKAFTNMPDPKQADAAGKLTELIRKLGWTLYADGYTEQSASLQGLFEALEKPKYAQAVVAIKAEPLVVNLQVANATFEATVAEKTKIANRQDDVPMARECRQKMSRYLKPLLGYIGLMADVDPAGYANTNEKVTKITEDIMAVARARQTRKENQQAEDL